MSADDRRTESIARPATITRKRAILEVTKGASTGARVEFEGRVRVGARPCADFVLDDARVSGVHCELTIGADLRVRDLESKNGTYVNGVRVVEAVLSPGEPFHIGRSKLRVLPVDGLVAMPDHAPDDFYGLVGQSPAMRRLIAQLEPLAEADTTVLIRGETGTGKERVAEALHLASARAHQPLVTVDCGSMPANLIEAELFGYERGAFTGAERTFPGAFERAHGGTLFLDEIGELPLSLQPKLLRVLETRKVQRLGGERSVPIVARIVAATNRDLLLEMLAKRFREDLYYRVAVVTVEIPPLRERIEDLPFLVDHLLRSIGYDPTPFLTVEAIAELAGHRWPGNVRELRNTLERAASLAAPLALDRTAPSRDPIDIGVPLRLLKERLIADLERRYLAAMLAECQGNLSEVARRAGVERMTVYRLIRRHGIRPTTGARS
ncbi:MAG TPA: sigma 54-interacting transcriptional regulator [Polyangia bacterium]|nr:sigma 54-interacting transcriptional regulator [Polyangia bacterium]